jgi:hypothetical protein
MTDRPSASQSAPSKAAARHEASTLVRRFLPIRPAMPAGHVRLRTLIFIRWIAIVGQIAALVVVTAWLEFDLPVVEAAAVIAVAAVVNLSVALLQRGTVWLRDPAATASLGFDLIQLLALLALTGGLDNPFAILILAPVVVSAATLSRRSTFLLSALAIAGIALLGLWHLPLPWAGSGLMLPPIYLLGVWTALVLAVAFTAAYVSSLASESRRMADALAATQLALERTCRRTAPCARTSSCCAARPSGAGASWPSSANGPRALQGEARSRRAARTRRFIACRWPPWSRPRRCPSKARASSWRYATAPACSRPTSRPWRVAPTWCTGWAACCRTPCSSPSDGSRSS